LFDHNWFFKCALMAGPTGFIALLAGWITTESGRQPYTVYGLLRTSESVSPIAVHGVAASLLAFIMTYLFVFGAGIFYIWQLMKNPPSDIEPETPAKGPIRAAGVTPAPSVTPGPIIKGRE
jgi:cytochrome d ubiquinol oxidase subunit I